MVPYQDWVEWEEKSSKSYMFSNEVRSITLSIGSLKKNIIALQYLMIKHDLYHKVNEKFISILLQNCAFFYVVCIIFMLA